MNSKHRRCYSALLLSALALAALPVWSSRATPAAAAGPDEPTPPVRARFDLSAPKAGPFPSDRFTTPDATQNTGRRVNLSHPDCQERPDDCQDIDVLNTLDGFNVQPRLSVPFDGPIDVNSVTSRSVFLVRLGSTLPGGAPEGKVIGINQIVWDPESTTLHVESDELLEQHTRYGLIVTRGVRDESGTAVRASDSFLRFLLGPVPDPGLREYRQALLSGLAAARRAGVPQSEVISASVFTTQSVTAILEKIRDQIKAATPEPADFNLGPGGTRTVFPLNAVTRLTWNQHTRVDQPLTPVQIGLGAFRLTPGAVGQLAFGKFLSPDYQIHPQQIIPPVPTRTGTPAVQGMNEIYFNLVLPAGPRPPGGWPVAIYGPGSGGNKEGVPLASFMTAHYGMATIVINPVAHGFGPLGTLTLEQTGAEPVTFPSGGRGFDVNGDGVIGNQEGQAAQGPWRIIGSRDGNLQTTADLMQLVRVIEIGMDVDGDGSRDLDPSRIYYLGNSMGGRYGAQLLAVEPAVRAGALLVPGASFSEAQRVSTPNRPVRGNRLAERVPSLINAPGITSVGGVPVDPPYFHENLPLRDGVPLTVGLSDGTSQVIRSPLINTVPGAIQIQEFFDNREWVLQPGDSTAYAPHLRKAPLAGVPAKPVLIQFAVGDQTTPTLTATALLRAGDLADRATLYRHDLAFAENPARPKNPHNFLFDLSAANIDIALGATGQIALFLASDGSETIHPKPRHLFEVPVVSPLPEGIDYIP